MLRRVSFIVLAALAACPGCSMCQSCDDYGGSYYGGRVGDWDDRGPRAGSVHAGPVYDHGEPYEAATDGESG
jgi:hypothetical protein